MTLLLVCLVILPIRLLQIHVLGVTQVPTNSMENTILPGDRIVVGNIRGSIERNDIIVFNHPDGSCVQLLKRVIGLPGDTVLIRSGTVYINSSPIAPPAAIRFSPADAVLDFPHPDLEWTMHYFGPVLVPQKGMYVSLDSINARLYWSVIQLEKGEGVDSIDGYVFNTNSYFVLGDYRTNSIDSRYFGFVPRELIVGRALIVYFSRDPHTRQIRWRCIGKRLN